MNSNENASQCEKENPARRCPRCERVLPLTPRHWYRNRSNPGGFDGWCKDCRKQYQRSRPRRRAPKYGEVNWDSKKRRWTAEEERILRELYPVSDTSDVAARLKRSERAVRFRAHKLGIEKIRPGTTRPDVWRKAEDIAAAYREGESQSSLGSRYGVGLSTIRDILLEQGCAIRGQLDEYYARRTVIGCQLHVQCTKCGEWKPRTSKYFRKAINSSDGLAAHCTECARELEQSYLDAHPEQRTQMREYSRAYHRRKARALWAARWRAAADILLSQEEEYLERTDRNED
jgi:hypothetical protein